MRHLTNSHPTNHNVMANREGKYTATLSGDQDKERETDINHVINTLLTNLPGNPSLKEKLQSSSQGGTYANAVKTGTPNNQTGRSNSCHSPPQRNLDMNQTTESLWRLARSSRLLAERGHVRMGFLADIDKAGHLERWSTGEEELPVYARSSRLLLEMIGKVKYESAVKIQRLVYMALEEKAASDEEDCQRILRTIQGMLSNGQGCTFEEAEEKLNGLVAKDKAELVQQMQKRARLLSGEQHTMVELALGRTTVPKEVATNQGEEVRGDNSGLTNSPSPSQGNQGDTNNQNKDQRDEATTKTEPNPTKSPNSTRVTEKMDGETTPTPTPTP